MTDLTKDISKSELNELPVEVLPIPVVVIDDMTPIGRVQEVCGQLREAEIVGFDTETKPSFTKGVIHKVSLLQLSNAECAFIFRLMRLSDEAKKHLKTLVEDKNLIKVGVGVHDDARILRSDHEWTPAGMVDLRKMTVEKQIQVGSLSKIYAILFGKRLTKGQRLSDWEKETLTEAQINYAGLDAWAGLRIFDALKEIFKSSMVENSFEPLRKIAPKTRTFRKRWRPAQTSTTQN
ncbi:3'-5' exonuclease [Porphyromonas sp.]|uniref:3'-5' exonuclease n=1 Tax=Porphyromonas sp. TaxID=1924944 RepID=UPI0026DAF7B0|nr:3'-5' exonuclease [Porphyromonas sp.]MDO4695225.1 3'-5' exonuclease [Porphyromonas sp.]MDO4770973.1 3'-5' exonuclease [Porphyromonas sp.]